MPAVRTTCTPFNSAGLGHRSATSCGLEWIEQRHPSSIEVLDVAGNDDQAKRWPGLSGQVPAFDKWVLCRLPLSFAVVGASRKEGVARLE